MTKIYDVIVLGAGPAGLTAGIYGARAKMSTLVLEKQKYGGQIVTTNEVANYPGCEGEETGPTLIAKMVSQLETFGGELKKDGVKEVDFESKIKKVTTENGDVYEGRTIVIATGASPRKLGVPGEKELTGKGVSYCATCDGDFFTDLEVYAIGGGDAAMEEAMFLTRFARKVTIVHRFDYFEAAKSIVAKAEKNEKMDFIMETSVQEFKGDGILESIVLKNEKTGEITEVFADEEDGTFGCFVFIGYVPQKELFENVIDNDRGYILTNDVMETNIPGVFAAGDIRSKTLRQVVTATADGALAAVQAEKYIEANFHE